MKNYLKKFKNMPIELKASVSYTICNILQKSLSFLTLPLFTRLLTTTQYGQYTIYASWMSILTTFLTLELPYGTFNTAMVNYKDDRDGYISTVQTICTIFTLVALLIYLPFSSFLNKFLELPTFLIIVMFFEILFQAAFMFWCGKRRFEYKYKSIIVITLLIAVLSPALALIFVFSSKEKGYARILGYSLITIAFGLIFYFINLTKGKKPFKKEYWKYAITFNVPLLIYYVSQTIFNQSDRLMISRFCGVDKAAIYGVAYNLAMVLILVLNAINNAYTPWLYKKIDEKKPQENKKISAYIALLMAVLLSGIIWLAPEIIYVMAGKNYSAAKWVVPPVAASLLLLLYTQFSNNVEFLYKKKFYLIIASLVPAVVNIVLNYIFIPKFGFLAAGYTTLVSYLLFALISYLFIIKYLKKGQELYGLFNVKILLLILAGFIGVNILGMALYNFLIARIIVMVVVLIALIIFRKKIFALIKSLKSKGEENVSQN